MKGNKGGALSLSSVAYLLVIACLAVCVCALWSKISALNDVVVSLDEKFYKIERSPQGVQGVQGVLGSGQPSPFTASACPPTSACPPAVCPTVPAFRRKPGTRKTMKEIGSETGTDKITEHGYDRFYPLFLEPLRDLKGLKMLEIGYNLGFSYQMWLQYFPLGMVYFFEKDDGHKYLKARFTGDQGKIGDLKRMLEEKDIVEGLDFIIDDGSHHPEHQIVSFRYLFEHGLKAGGVYIIEDTETSYWRSGDTYGMATLYGRDSPRSAINLMKGLVDVVNRKYALESAPHTSALGPYVDEWVQSVFFGPNSVVVVKMTPEEKNRFSSSSYLWKDKLKAKA
mmetsp:Transcript_26037/g.57650  ORF Transcript_26037/g.57650 Transcript_26037/m.57650 type:complete len:338 (+) Transcript_26037:84-1097(+)